MIHGFWVQSKTESFFTCSDPSAFVILGASSKFFDIFVHFCVSYAIGRCKQYFSKNKSIYPSRNLN